MSRWVRVALWHHNRAGNTAHRVLGFWHDLDGDKPLIVESNPPDCPITVSVLVTPIEGVPPTNNPEVT